MSISRDVYTTELSEAVALQNAHNEDPVVLRVGPRLEEGLSGMALKPILAMTQVML